MVSSEKPEQWSNQLDSSFTTTKDRPPRPPSRKSSSQTRPFLSGPIPPTLDCEYDDRGTCVSAVSQGFARVHGSDAKEIHKRGTSGTGVPFIFEVQGTGLFSKYGSETKPPKNHLNENVKRIRTVVRESRERQAMKVHNEPKPPKALWRSRQYDHIQSKVKQRLDEDTQRSLSRPQSARGNFLQAHKNTGPENIRSQSASSFRRASIASSTNFSANPTDDQTKLDYVKLNSQWVKNVPKVRKAVSEEVVEQVRTKKEQQLKEYYEKQKGRIPDYIEKIKERKTRELNDQLANTPDPDCPPGHVKMDEEKRLSTLRQLEQTRAELEKKMSHLPIRNDSLTLRRTKEELEKKIIEADEAIKIFSRPKVFVKVQE